MTINTHSIKVGDRIIYKPQGPEEMTMVVWEIRPPGTAGTRESAGPHVCAWLGPGRFGIVIHHDSERMFKVRMPDGTCPRCKSGHRDVILTARDNRDCTDMFHQTGETR